MYYQDIRDAIQESGVVSGLSKTSIPGFFGVGIQTYNSSGIAGIREKIREGKMTKEEWDESIKSGIISEDLEQQAIIIRESQEPEEVVGFGNLTTKEQLAMIPKMSDEAIKKVSWTATQDTLTEMYKANPKKFIELGIDNVIYQKKIEGEYKSEFKKRGLDPIEATKQAYITAKQKIKSPIIKRVMQLGVGWSFSSPQVGQGDSAIPISPKDYKEFSEKLDERTYNEFSKMLNSPTFKMLPPSLQKDELKAKRDSIRNELRGKMLGKYYAISDLKNKFVKQGISKKEATQKAINYYALKGEYNKLKSKKKKTIFDYIQ
jgi:hypothetical protein